MSLGGGLIKIFWQGEWFLFIKERRLPETRRDAFEYTVAKYIKLNFCFFKHEGFHILYRPRIWRAVSGECSLSISQCGLSVLV